jgi:hypothetical protein
MAGVDKVLVEALKLDPGERARVAAELLATLEPDVPAQDRSDAEWIAEIERRARAAVQGTEGLPWPEARNKIQTRLSSH